MAAGRIQEVTATPSLAGGQGTFDWIIRWYFLTAPTSVKTWTLQGMDWGEMTDEVDLLEVADGVELV